MTPACGFRTIVRVRIRTLLALKGTGFRAFAGLLVAAYVAVWSTPCLPLTVRFESARSGETAALAEHASSLGHELADRSAGHAGHDTASIEGEGSGFSLVAKCSCGCGSLPKAAATTTAPGHALFVQVPVPGPPPFEMKPTYIDLTPILTPPDDSIEHVPIRFLC